MTKPEQLKALAKRMKPMHVKMAIALSEGKNNQDAYIAAKGKAAKAIKNPRDAAYKIMQTNVDISIYAELSKECVVEVAQERGLMTFEDKALKLESLVATLSRVDADKGVIDAANTIKALMAHNAMTGDLASIKTESKHSFTDASKDELERKLAELQSQL